MQNVQIRGGRLLYICGKAFAFQTELELHADTPFLSRPDARLGYCRRRERRPGAAMWRTSRRILDGDERFPC